MKCCCGQTLFSSNECHSGICASCVHKAAVKGRRDYEELQERLNDAAMRKWGPLFREIDRLVEECEERGIDFNAICESAGRNLPDKLIPIVRNATDAELDRIVADELSVECNS